MGDKNPEQVLEEYIHLSKYSRWREEWGRREVSLEETAERWFSFWQKRLTNTVIHPATWELLMSKLSKAKTFLVEKKAMPSMRTLMTAGEALELDEAAGFNCWAKSIDHPRVFDELFYLLMVGGGVGWSVERQYIQKLPPISEDMYATDTVIVVPDSRIGWCKSLKELLALLWQGQIPQWDLSQIRPAGARLKTFGGRACLTGDTILYKDRKKARGYNEITIKDLFDMERSQGKWKGKPNHFKSVRLRSLDEETGQFYRNNVITVVDNGVAPIYEILTENGYRIKATGNHRFMRETGDYDYVDNFSPGDLIAVNGSTEKKTGICMDCGCSISRRAKRCKPCFDKHQTQSDVLGTTARQRKDCQDYIKDHCEICNGIDDGSERFERHHIDGNPENNDHENLMYLHCKCHQELHAKERTFPDPYSHKYLSYDKIISIEYVGEEHVYDLQMETPNHNFVANGFVSHNSGPGPLDRLFKFVVSTFTKAAGRRLNSLECHDLMCMIADTVIVGSVRRSAGISLSDLTDDRMRKAKMGSWWEYAAHRRLSNNSTAYTEKPDLDSFLEEMLSLYQSRAGERGLINKKALKKKAEGCGREHPGDYLLNPCGEAILRDTGGCCNLTEVVVRPKDTYNDLLEKVEVAAFVGTLQSLLTNFRYLRPVWKKNQEEERLLGVSLTGIQDHPVLRSPHSYPGASFGFPKINQVDGLVYLSDVLLSLSDHARSVNKEVAGLLGIPESKQVTLVKPSGTVSKLCSSSSGMHPRPAPFYIQRVTQDIKDPLTDLMLACKIPHSFAPEGEKVYFAFPIKSPDGCVTSSNLGPLDQLNLWKIYQTFWCDGNPSQTVYYTDSTFIEVQKWMWENWDTVGGLSFFPSDDHIYDNAPWEPITEEVYNKLVKEFPAVDWSLLSDYEKEDCTTSAQEGACAGGACELL